MKPGLNDFACTREKFDLQWISVVYILVFIVASYMQDPFSICPSTASQEFGNFVSMEPTPK